MTQAGSAFNVALMAVLRAEREAQRRTVKELAESAGVYSGTLLRYLNNHREMPVSVFFDVAAALRTDPLGLFARAQDQLVGPEATRRALRFDENQPRPSPEEVGRRVALLVEVLARGRGSKHGFREISPLLLKRGVRFTDREWAYLVEGRAEATPDDGALRAIAAELGVDPAYLLGPADDSEVIRIDSQLQFLREMQAGRVNGISARAAADVTPETLRAITNQIREEEGPTPK